MSGKEYDTEKLKRLIRQGRQMQELNDCNRQAPREVDAEDGPAPTPTPAPIGGERPARATGTSDDVTRQQAIRMTLEQAFREVRADA